MSDYELVSTNDTSETDHSLRVRVDSSDEFGPDDCIENTTEFDSEPPFSYPSSAESAAASEMLAAVSGNDDHVTRVPSVIRYEALVPISRPPTKGRDVLYYWCFILQLGLSATIGSFTHFRTIIVITTVHLICFIS